MYIYTHIGEKRVISEGELFAEDEWGDCASLDDISSVEGQNISVCIHMCVCVYIYIHMYMYVSMYIHVGS